MGELSTVELVRNLKSVVHAATQEPVTITQGRKPKFVLMAIEDYDRLSKRSDDPRRAYGPGETPPDIAELFRQDLDRLIANAGNEP